MISIRSAPGTRAPSVPDINSKSGMQETVCDEFGKKTKDAASKPGGNLQVVFQGLMFS